jgi:hypothetical protein
MAVLEQPLKIDVVICCCFTELINYIYYIWWFLFHVILYVYINTYAYMCMREYIYIYTCVCVFVVYSDLTNPKKMPLWLGDSSGFYELVHWGWLWNTMDNYCI